MATIAAATSPTPVSSPALDIQNDEADKSGSTTSTHIRKGKHSKSGEPRSVYIPYVVLALLVFLYAGILTQILAQFFGVLGLTVNATPKATDEAKAIIQFDAEIKFQADTWAIGKGLSTYATIAWASAAACAAVATALFRTPRYPKVV